MVSQNNKTSWGDEREIHVAVYLLFWELMCTIMQGLSGLQFYWN